MTQPMPLRTVREGIELSPIKAMELKASAIPDVVSLAQGIPSFDTLDIIKRAAIDAIRDGKVSKYSLSPGLPALREAIELDLRGDHLYYDYSKEILITAGSIEAITAILLTILEPGSEVVIFSPSYASYPQAVKVAHGKVVWVSLDEDNGWSLNLDRVEQAITPQTRVILFANPNNPTGTVIGRDQLQALAKLAKRHSIYLLIDEVYKELRYSNQPYWNPASDPTVKDFIVTIYSFSKIYAMTGWRVAFAAGEASLMQEVLKVHDALVTCAPVVSQYAALAALELAKTDREDVRKELEFRRNYLCERLDRLKPFFTYQFPTASYFVFPRYRRDQPSVEFANELLERAHVAVVAGSAFGPAGEHHIRLCFGRAREDIDRAISRIASYIQIL
ncbi:pyridoxal phosphate-dependent aminotransferase [Candidatus Uhrbacteria bacterium]|nr:pyridoxal phosphate-dependent aminotransferase [Candidatus Uhrbacteria bacterium]